MADPNSTLRHAWFSEQAANSFGSTVYRLPYSDTTVEVTVVSDDPEYDQQYGWEDKVYVGLVAEYVSKGRSGCFHESGIQRRTLLPKTQMLFDGPDSQKLRDLAAKLLGNIRLGK